MQYPLVLVDEGAALVGVFGSIGFDKLFKYRLRLVSIKQILALPLVNPWVTPPKFDAFLDRKLTRTTPFFEADSIIHSLHCATGICAPRQCGGELLRIISMRQPKRY